MGTIICSNCGASITNSAICEYCGSSLRASTSYREENILEQHKPENGKLYIQGYQGVYLIAPSVKIYIDGQLVGSIKKGGLMELDIHHDCLIEFKCHIRSNEYTAKRNKIETLQLAFDDFSGALELYMINSTTINGE